jgi:hypothetical protein
VSSRSSWPEVPTTSTSWQISLGLGAGDGRRNCRLDCHERGIGSASRTNNSMTEEKDKEEDEDEDEDEKSMGHTDHQAVQLDCVSVFMSSRCRSRWKVRAEVSLFVRWGSGQAWSGIYTDSRPGQINTAAGVGGEATPSREKGGRRHGDRQPIPAHHRPERSIQRSTGGGGKSRRRVEYRKRVGKRATLSRDPGRGFWGEWRGSCGCSCWLLASSRRSR